MHKVTCVQSLMNFHKWMHPCHQPPDSTILFFIEAYLIYNDMIVSGVLQSDSVCDVVQSLTRVQLFETPMDHSTPGFPLHHHLLELAQTHVHWVGDAILSSHPLSSPSPPAFNPSQHRGLFQWVSSSNQVAKVLELQLQHQSFQQTFRVDFL